MTTKEVIEVLWNILEFEHDRKYISSREAIAIRSAISCVELIDRIKGETEKAMVESC